MDGNAHKSKATFVVALVVSAVILLPACGSNSSSTTGISPSISSSTNTTTPGPESPGSPLPPASGPALVEVNPAGDIPDNQAFVAYHGAGFTVTTPEGWARSSTGSSVVFSDKYNSITISEAVAAQAPTVASAQADEVPTIKASSKDFVPGAVKTAQRKAGTAVLITYQALSQVNPVTGKAAIEAAERYTFWKAGKSVSLTLAAPVGSDNVDPWRTVTESFTWTK